MKEFSHYFLARWCIRLLLIAATLFVGLPPSIMHAEGQPGGREVVPGLVRALDNLKAVSGEAPIQTTRIYDRNGILLYELTDYGRRTLVALEDVPEAVIQATVATEDRRFFEHTGIDLNAMARAVWQNVQADDIVSGGSTITQQLARGLRMDDTERYELSVERKLREASIALDIERRFSKAEIMEMYLNTVYYGHQAYGIAAAAWTYFNKDVSELTLGESTLLAGLPQSPAVYDPFVNPEAALGRQRVVVKLMQEAGYLDATQARAALAQPLAFVSPVRPPVRAPHFVEYIRDLLEERYGTLGMHRGLEVYTSIDLRYQELTEAIARAQIQQLGDKYDAHNAAIVAVNPPTGEILAMVGSLDFYDDRIDGQINMALSPRQPGSAIKPVLYASAFDNGWTPASVIWDTETSYLYDGGYYTPENVTGRHYGPVRLRTALANSLNIPAIKLMRALGPERLINTARAMGLTSLRQPAANYGLAMAVGGYEVSLLELTHAFATLANMGQSVALHPVLEVRDVAGRLLYEAGPPTEPTFAVSPQSAYQVSSILSDNRSRRLVFAPDSALVTSRPAAVKTGTTNDWRDNLTVGYTPTLAVGVWVGNSNARTMKNAYGIYTAAPIWHDIMEAVWADPGLYDAQGYTDALPDGFTQPPGMVKAPVCDITPNNFTGRCPNAYEEAFALEPPPDPAPFSPAMVRKNTTRRGYCLPNFRLDLPTDLQREITFIPRPQDAIEARSAVNWATRFGFALLSIRDCSLRPVERKIAAAEPLTEPRRLIRIPKPPPPIDGEALMISDDPLRPGGYAVLESFVQEQGLNMRGRPGTEQRVVGVVRRDQIMLLLDGPVREGGSRWFEVRNVDSGAIGWVHAAYIRSLRPTATGDVASQGFLYEPTAAPTGTVGETIRLQPGLIAAFVHERAGSSTPVVGWARPGDRLELVEGPVSIYGNDWYSIRNQSGELAGWIHGGLLAFGSAQARQ